LLRFYEKADCAVEAGNRKKPKSKERKVKDCSKGVKEPPCFLAKARTGEPNSESKIESQTAKY